MAVSHTAQPCIDGMIGQGRVHPQTLRSRVPASDSIAFQLSDWLRPFRRGGAKLDRTLHYRGGAATARAMQIRDSREVIHVASPPLFVESILFEDQFACSGFRSFPVSLEQTKGSGSVGLLSPYGCDRKQDLDKLD